MGRFDTFYAQLPVWAQHGTVSAYGAYWHWLRFGRGYTTYLDGYLRRDSFSASEWQAWQQARLLDVLQNAATHVPYYREAWNNETKAAALAGHLEALPLLDKEPLRAAPEAFLRQDMAPKRRLTFHTSGSTGTPIATIWTAGELRQSLALREARSARWAGVSFQTPRATFSGRMVEPDPDSTGPYYR